LRFSATVAMTGYPPRVSRKRIRDTPLPVFWEKRLQAVENKGRELRKEKQEAARDLNVYQ